MRKAMIGTTVVLALWQLWPGWFLARVNQSAVAAQAAPSQKMMPAVVVRPMTMSMTTANGPAPRNCDKSYHVAFARCSLKDDKCLVHVADKWDLCEARGLWQN